MDILTYEEVDDTQMSELTLACFGHTYSKEHISKMVKNDSRIPEWGGELYAVEEGKVFGTVGMLFPKVKTESGTESGIEEVGGIRNVCTRASKSRKGTARRLLDEAHKRLADKGVRFSFLMTSKALVAYGLYEKLGYRDIYHHPTAFKEGGGTQSGVELKKEKDPEYVKDLYQGSTEGLNGLIVREPDYWQAIEARGWPDNDKVRIAYEDGKKIGYALYIKKRKQLDCEEIGAMDDKSLNKILGALESEAGEDDVVIHNVNPNHRDVLESRGYHIYDDKWDKVMVKDFEGEGNTERDILQPFHVSIYESF